MHRDLKAAMYWPAGSPTKMAALDMPLLLQVLKGYVTCAMCSSPQYSFL